MGLVWLLRARVLFTELRPKGRFRKFANKVAKDHAFGGCVDL